MVLQKDMALFCLAEFLAVFEFTFGDGGPEALAASLVFEDFYAVKVVLDVVSASDDADGVPLSRGIGLSAFCGQNVVQIRQSVGAFDFGVVVAKL